MVLCWRADSRNTVNCRLPEASLASPCHSFLVCSAQPANTQPGLYFFKGRFRPTCLRRMFVTCSSLLDGDVTLLWDSRSNWLETHPAVSLPAHVLTTGKHLSCSSKPGIPKSHLLSPHPTAAAPQILLALGSFKATLPKQTLFKAFGVCRY